MKFTGERFMPTQHGSIALEHLNRYYFVVNQVELTGKTVLDIASGEGYGTNILSQFASNVIGVDISYEAVEYAKKKYRAENLNFIQGDATKIPLENNSVDVVVSFETIEHHDKHTEMMIEIKRILKTNGLVIISSPDKYFYSDVPNYKNEFHIKELYYEEFKNLIKNYFKYTLFYSQNIFIGSIIALDENIHDYKVPIIIDREGHSAEFSPVYNIAIGSDNVDFMPKNQLVLYKDSDKIITPEDIQNAIVAGASSVYKTKAYRLGIFILKPLKKIKRKFNA